MPEFKVGIASLVTRTSVCSSRRRAVVSLGLSAPTRGNSSSEKHPARSVDAWRFAREAPEPEPRATMWRAAQAADAACEGAVNNLANGP
jgi:hypothetical protein